MLFSMAQQTLSYKTCLCLNIIIKTLYIIFWLVQSLLFLDKLLCYIFASLAHFESLYHFKKLLGLLTGS